MLLGIDGGGTKTVFLLTDQNGAVRGLHRDSSAYHVQIGFGGLKALLERGLKALQQQSGARPEDITSTFLGLPALGEDSRVDDQLRNLPAQVLGHQRYTCGNDMMCAWAGSLAGEDGINVISGTGSIAYGEHKGKSARCGGWGELIGDEGSAFWIAREGLVATSRMADGRMEPSPLLDRMRQHFNLSNDLDLSGIILSGPDATRDRIASLCGLVVETASVGDMVAEQILITAGNELGAHITSIAKQLSFAPNETVPVSYSGGVITKVAIIQDRLRTYLAERPEQYELRKPLFSPTTGAVILAANALGIQLQPAILQNIDTATQMAPAAI